MHMHGSEEGIKVTPGRQADWAALGGASCCHERRHQQAKVGVPGRTHVRLRRMNCLRRTAGHQPVPVV